MSESAVNYIAHQSGVLETLFSDERISPWHISLYMALFITWNQTRFKSEISITREEIMDKSKIGSANTYTKCIKQLDEWGYIKYLPSTNKYKASKVHMYRFDKGSDNGADNGTDKSSDNGTDNGSDKAPVTHLRPFLNNTKHKENNNKQYKTSKGESNSPPPPPSSKNKSIKKKKKFIPPKLEETKA
ncbi:MAG: transcriptional regulator, partial [Brumimicrobium sp.]